MANWYIAPDGVTKTGLTFANIGDSGYGTAWNKAVRWSDFQGGSGAWANRANNDTFHFLACGKPYLINNGSGWVTLANNQTGTTFQSESIDGTVMRGAVFKGTRDWPWPKAGETATYAGETFMTISAASAAPTFNSLSWVNMLIPGRPSGGGDIGHVTFNDCYTRNTSRGLFYTESRTDGRCSVEFNRCELHGYNKGNARIWANNDGLGIIARDSFFDSEHQNDNSNFNNASTPSGLHIMDAIPTVQTVKSPMTVERCTFINHRAGYNGSAYPQGDGVIGEENVGTITAKDVLTYGNGDRGVDLKCAGQLIRHTSFGDGYALGHHLDTIPVDVYNAVYYTGARLTASGAPPSVACIQASGWTRAFKGWFSARPTAAQAAFANTAISTASVDPHKWQSQIYGGTHQGKVEMTDCYETVKTSVSATESTGYAGTSVNGRIGAVFGLTPSTAYTFKVRGLGPDGAPGTFSSNVAVTMSADGGGERVALAAPTGLTATPTSGGLDCTFTWTGVAEDAGTSVQGYIIEVDFGDGKGFIPMLPGKSSSPFTLSGFQPATAYTARVRAYDSNMNLGTASSTQGFTTLSGSVSANTPNAPTNVATDAGWVDHCNAWGVGHPSTLGAGFTAPSTGAVSLYEVWDSTGTTLYTRMGSIRLSSHDTPTLTKTNVTLTTV